MKVKNLNYHNIITKQRKTIHLPTSLLGTTAKPTMPVALVIENISDLRANLTKEAQVEIKMMPTPTMSPSPITKTFPTTSTPSYMVKLTQYKQHKLIIPIIRPITHTRWATYPSMMTVTEISQKTTGRFNEGTNLKINENIYQNSNSGLETGNQIDKTEELVIML